ncbi:MAG: stage V sporulation protein AC [Bacilli bacterium]|nr:stage V sporulation protein AC [Bacilli bacterium]
MFKKALDNNKVKRPVLKNTLKAFLVGGIISVIAEAFLSFYLEVLGLDKDISSSLMSITMVFIASLLTGLGVYDRLGQFSGAGTIVPITGFSNSMTSSALESKSEGLILGVMTNMFKLAGAIIVAGVVSAFVAGNIIYLIGILV